MCTSKAKNPHTVKVTPADCVTRDTAEHDNICVLGKGPEPIICNSANYMGVVKLKTHAVIQEHSTM